MLLRNFCRFIVTVISVFSWGNAQATMARIETSRGPIDIELLDADAPLNVTNFLNYVRKGAYNNTIVHRSVPGFVIQLGGYALPSFTHIATDPAVKNEFSLSRSNLRGTVAMAKLGGNPDSATSEWFVNLGNNSANLDGQNGGFTVFGRVTPTSMAVVDVIAGLSRLACSSPFSDLPLHVAISPCSAVNSTHVVAISQARVLPARETSAPSDRIFNYIEAAYPQHAVPTTPVSNNGLGYYFRYYTKTNAYLGTKDNQLYYLLPSNNGVPVLLGTVDEWLALAAAAGY
jgi:peptidyl-prolyl cis-trans isomerase A (cyclophilin A)